MNSFCLMGIKSTCFFFHNRSFPSFSSFSSLPDKGLLRICAKRRKHEVLIMDEKKLEDELFEFMGKSKKPNSFPTKNELIDAGRHDLVDAILKHGGWFALGWNLDQEKEEIKVSSSSCASNEFIKREDDGKVGIEKILSGLEEERNFANGAESNEKKLSGKRSFINGEPKKWNNVEFIQEEGKNINGNATNALQEQKSADDTWNGYVSYVDRFVNNNFVKDIYKKNEKTVPQSDDINGEQKNSDCELHSTIKLVKSSSENTVTDKGDKNIDTSVEVMRRLSDELEHKQTEIRIARDKLGSTRAKLAVLRGKMIMQGQKIIDIRTKGVDAVQKKLSHLRYVPIKWYDSASEVILVGSFDGWSNQRRMERLKEGIFIAHLRLYPGRYQVKFIVDGVWMVDPLRPTVNDTGHENNLVIVD